MRPEAFLKVQEYIKIAETRFQGVVIAIRAWNSGRKNPLSTVSLALRQGELDEQLLKELENADRKTLSVSVSCFSLTQKRQRPTRRLA
ncbi:hypothetical protein CCL09_22430 [Pseudomonas congelans]|nr:hypothetical protein CCL09_22430 [Pseudomonas congelans]PBQ22002.1 hypothetical protein CCL08_01650 [Pseudomonas congelans]